MEVPVRPDFSAFAIQRRFFQPNHELLDRHLIEAALPRRTQSIIITIYMASDPLLQKDGRGQSHRIGLLRLT